MAWQEQLNAWFKQIKGKPKTSSLAVVLGVAAMVLILLSELWPSQAAQETPAEMYTTQSAASYQEELETQLAGLIQQIAGAGETTVMITLESGEERIYATDTQTGQNQSQQTHVLLEDGTALEETVYLPTICGVAVVCEGGGDVGIQARITSMLSALLDVPSNRICVEQRGSYIG